MNVLNINFFISLTKFSLHSIILQLQSYLGPAPSQHSFVICRHDCSLILFFLLKNYYASSFRWNKLPNSIRQPRDPDHTTINIKPRDFGHAYLEAIS